MRILAATMTILGLAAGPLAWGQQADGQQKQSSCLECHQLLEDNLGRPAQLFAEDIHRHSGFSCADCHGGDPTTDDPDESMSPRKGFKGKIKREAVPALCGRCHSDSAVIHKFKPQQRVDQLAQYRTSVHGQRLATGDTKVANCTDCHSVHDIREVRHALSPVHPLRLPETCAHCHADAEHMKGYGIPTDQFEKYHQSVHWEALAERGDLSAPSCASCHGNHGAVPPGVDSVANVCGSCHVVFQNLFEESPHEAAFASMGLAACVACHGNHKIERPAPEMLGVTEGAICLDCHSEGEAAYTVAGSMRQRLDDLRAALDESEQILDRAEQSGMEVSQGRLEWNSAHEELIKARVEVHGFRLEPVDKIVAEGIKVAQQSQQAGVDALAERDFRRRGLALSLLTIAITMAGLWLAVRAVESSQSKGTGPA